MTQWKDRRRSLGLAQADVARRAGISRTALSQIENGHSQPHTATAEALRRALDPFADPVRLVHGEGALAAADLLRALAVDGALRYALTLDVAAWLHTAYQTPAAAWAYVRPLASWRRRLRRRGVRAARAGERADLVLLRAPDDVLAGVERVHGHALAPVGRVLADSARLGGRHGLDAARLCVDRPDARAAGLRLDPDALWKIFEEGGRWT